MQAGHLSCCCFLVCVLLFLVCVCVGGGGGGGGGAGGAVLPWKNLKFLQIRIRAERPLKQELTDITSNMVDYLWIYGKVANLPFFQSLFSSCMYFRLYLHSYKSQTNRMNQN